MELQSRGAALALVAGCLASLGLAGCATQQAALATAPAAPAARVAVAAPASAPGPAAAAHASQPAPALPEPSALEVEAGIQIAHIGVTASGGLVDARFRVLDPSKANILLGNAANMPTLIAGDLPPLMAPHHSLKGGRYAKDQVVIILYPNTRQAVQPGTAVSVAFGPVRIGPVTAQ